MEIIYKLDDFPEPGDRDLLNGIREINKNDYKEALKYFEKGANYDNEYAYLFAAIIHFTGFDLPQRNPDKAMVLLKEIALQWKNPVAQYLIAVIYDEGDGSITKDTKSSAEWFLLSARNEWLFSIGNVGFAYTYGRGIKEDHKKAIEWMEKILKNEDRETKQAKNEILYLFGNKKFQLNLTKADKNAVRFAQAMAQRELVSPVTMFCDYNYRNPSWPEITRILIWYVLTNRKSSAVVSSCQNYMTDIYLSGKSNIPRDSEKAMYWQRKGANNGNPRCCRDLGFQYEIGTYLKQDYKEAMKWYLRAKSIGNDSIETFRIGSLYYRGLGVDKNWKKALTYLEEAVAIEKHVRAVLLMGIIYEKGKHGVSRNIRKAIACYMEAFDLGSPEGAIALALIYSKGLDVTANGEKAVHWISQAMLAGSQNAQIFPLLIDLHGLKAAAQMMLEIFDFELDLFTEI